MLPTRRILLWTCSLIYLRGVLGLTETHRGQGTELWSIGSVRRFSLNAPSGPSHSLSPNTTWTAPGFAPSSRSGSFISKSNATSANTAASAGPVFELPGPSAKGLGSTAVRRTGLVSNASTIWMAKQSGASPLASSSLVARSGTGTLRTSPLASTPAPGSSSLQPSASSLKSIRSQSTASVSISFSQSANSHTNSSIFQGPVIISNVYASQASGVAPWMSFSAEPAIVDSDTLTHPASSSVRALSLSSSSTSEWLPPTTTGLSDNDIYLAALALGGELWSVILLVQRFRTNYLDDRLKIEILSRIDLLKSKGLKFFHSLGGKDSDLPCQNNLRRRHEQRVAIGPRGLLDVVKDIVKKVANAICSIAKTAATVKLDSPHPPGPPPLPPWPEFEDIIPPLIQSQQDLSDPDKQDPDEDPDDPSASMRTSKPTKTSILSSRTSSSTSSCSGSMSCEPYDEPLATIIVDSFDEPNIPNLAMADITDVIGGMLEARILAAAASEPDLTSPIPSATSTAGERSKPESTVSGSQSSPPASQHPVTTFVPGKNGLGTCATRYFSVGIPVLEPWCWCPTQTAPAGGSVGGVQVPWHEYPLGGGRKTSDCSISSFTLGG